jgi:hypothetical protein
MKRSEVMSNDQTQDDISPPVVRSNILPLPPPMSSSNDEESTMSHSSTTSAPHLPSTPSSPPYLLLLVPSDSMAGRGLGSAMTMISNLEDLSGHIKVELQGRGSNVSTVSTASFPIKTTKTQTPSSSGSAEKHSEVKSGWIEVGCEVVSLRKISGVPVAS